MDERRPGGEAIHAPLRLLLTVCALKEGMDCGIMAVKQIGIYGGTCEEDHENHWMCITDSDYSCNSVPALELNETCCTMKL